jgi:hypothetical protein
LVPWTIGLVLSVGIGFVPAARAESCPAGYEPFDRANEAIGCVRSLPNTPYREYLVLVELAAPPDRVIELLWRRIANREVGGLKRRDFIVTEPQRIVFYDQIRTPVVSDRDYTCEATMQPARADGRREIRYQTRNDLGPPPDPHHTRIPNLRAAWIADPSGRGTHLSYVTYSEPGGSVPAWMVRGAQAKHAMADVFDLLRALNR